MGRAVKIFVLLKALALTGLFVQGAQAQSNFPTPAEEVQAQAGKTCRLIQSEALRNNIPPEFFVRLIWKESRFDEKAISPAGAQGIAQFMPETARRRGLTDPYNMEKAIPASALYLSALRLQLGNLGLAAAAYNAGETRVDRWLTGAGSLPLETENYVLHITGESADVFLTRGKEVTIKPLDEKLSFLDACQALPVIETRAMPMAAIVIKPWAVQVAANFKKSATENAWGRIKSKNRSIISNLPVSISRVKSPRGRSGIFAARIGADSRGEADRICARLKTSGTPCMVVKN